MKKILQILTMSLLAMLVGSMASILIWPDATYQFLLTHWRLISSVIMMGATAWIQFARGTISGAAVMVLVAAVLVYFPF